jgi:hypothetical protein
VRRPAVGRGASPRREGAPGPTHGDGVGVRRLGTSDAVENRGTHGGGGLPEQQRAAMGGRVAQGPPFIGGRRGKSG